MPVNCVDINSCSTFWITSTGYEDKEYLGLPYKKDILERNPYVGEDAMSDEEQTYKREKIIEILRRGPYGVYVRVEQQFRGITAAVGKSDGESWIPFAGDKL